VSWLLVILATLWAFPAWAEGAASEEDLVGTWRLEMHTVTGASIPVIGTTRTQNHSLNLMHTWREGEGWRGEHVACSVQVETGIKLARTTLPPAFVEAVPLVRYPFVVEEKGGRRHVAMDLPGTDLGFDPQLSGGRVPQDRDDAGVADTDMDGHPGVTVHLEAPLFGLIKNYIVQHTVSIMRGEERAPGLIEGDLTMTEFQQRTIGASNMLFRGNPRIRPIDGVATFRMVRVPEGSTCPQLIEGLGGEGPWVF